MLTNTSEKLMNQNSYIEVNVEEVNRIKMSAEFSEAQYTRNGWGGEVIYEGFKIIISREKYNEEKSRYILNMLKNDQIYDTVEITQDNNYIQFTMWIDDDRDWCKSVRELEGSLYKTKEKMQAMLKIFNIESFELIGLFYYAPNFDY